MSILNGKIVYTVQELIEELKGYKLDQYVKVIGHDSVNVFFEKLPYKIEQNSKETEIYLYI